MNVKNKNSFGKVWWDFRSPPGDDIGLFSQLIIEAENPPTDKFCICILPGTDDANQKLAQEIVDKLNG